MRNYIQGEWFQDGMEKVTRACMYEKCNSKGSGLSEEWFNANRVILQDGFVKHAWEGLKEGCQGENMREMD